MSDTPDLQRRHLLFGAGAALAATGAASASAQAQSTPAGRTWGGHADCDRMAD
jgi:hypothetical protein